MALTGSTNLPSQGGNTPTPTTGTLTAIRDHIEPARGWWQVNVRPWHLVVFFGSYVVVVGSFVAFAATTGGIR